MRELTERLGAVIEPGSEEKLTSEVEPAESATPPVAEAAKAMKASKAPKIPKATDVPAAPEAAVVTEAPSLEADSIPEVTDASVASDRSEVVEAPVATEAPESVEAEAASVPTTEPEALEARTALVDGEPVLTPRATSVLRVVIALVVLILGIGGYLAIAHSKNGDNAKIQGKVALSAQELRDVVAAKKLTVYWAGPQTGAKYTLIATTPGIIYVRYLPGGVGLNDTKTLFRAIGTYAQKNAFTVSRNAGKTAGNTGFINADGNAVFYAKGRPTNIYIGIKGKDIQVEVFDPVVDQALGLVLVRGQISLVN